MGDWVHDCEIDDDLLVSSECPDVAAAKELAALMSEISEEHYCAGWLSGLEYALFSTAFEGCCFGEGISQHERQGLLELSRRCDGWCVYVDGVGPKYVPMLVWTKIYKEGYTEFGLR